MYQRDWAYAMGAPQLRAAFKAQADDFKVVECLPFEPSGDGQHAYLRLRKTGLNTVDVARQLQRFCRVKSKAIGYAGLKDKRAVTEQWFSIDLAGLSAEPDWQGLQSENLQVLQATRHRKRLRIGWVKSNRFDIVLRDTNADCQRWEERLVLLRENAVPNYFGQQRFGIGFDNIANSVELLLKPPHETKRRDLLAGKRGFHYSVIRSFLFNEILSSRVAAGNWQRALAGELLILDGSQSFFQCEQPDADIERRLHCFDIHPSGALPGREKERRFRIDEAQRWEQNVLQAYHDWIAALAEQGVVEARRALRVKPQGFDWHWPQADQLHITMTLPAGSYASAVLRELLVLDDSMQHVIAAGEE